MKVKLKDITPGTNYSRAFGVGDVSELAASMQEHGQINPIILTDDNELVAGYRRFAAANELQWDEIDAIRCVGDPALVNLIENMNREGLSLWEEIQAIRTVFGTDAKQATIARALSKSKTWVKPRLRIWDLPQEFQDKVRAGHSGIKEIRAMLSPSKPNSPTSTGMGTPNQADLKRTITWLMTQDRVRDAYVLAYATGTISEQELRDYHPEA